MVISFLLSCSVATDTAHEEGEVIQVRPVQTEELSAREVLTRISLDLRGFRPSSEELYRLESGELSLEDLTWVFLYSDAFEERLQSVFAEQLQTEQDSYDVSASAYGLEDQAAYVEAIGEEAPRLMARVVAEDLPWTEVVLADWTMANELLAEIWPLDYPADGSGWEKAHYTDTRPSAGVLAQNSFWWRYTSTLGNANRGRANAVSSIFLCSDFLERSITFDRDVNLLDEEALGEALRTNPGCVTCHNSVEPLAAYFWGFYYEDPADRLDASSYHPERERMWESYGEREPAYFGSPGYTLGDLGRQLAADPRLVECAVERAFSSMMHRDVILEDSARLSELREVFLEDDLNYRSLLAAITQLPEYQSGPTEDPRVLGRVMMDIRMYSRQVRALTGFELRENGFNLLKQESSGLKALARPGESETGLGEVATTTQTLVIQRIAEGAARYVVDSDRESDEPKLFKLVQFSETHATNEDLIRQQIQDLNLEVLGQDVDSSSSQVDAQFELWVALYEAEHNPSSAWAGLLSVMLRDPDFLFF